MFVKRLMFEIDRGALDVILFSLIKYGQLVSLDLTCL